MRFLERKNLVMKKPAAAVIAAAVKAVVIEV